MRLEELERDLIRGYYGELWLKTKKRARKKLAKLSKAELVRLAKQLLERRFGPDNYDYLNNLDFYSITEVIIYNLAWLSLRRR